MNSYIICKSNKTFDVEEKKQINALHFIAV